MKLKRNIRQRKTTKGKVFPRTNSQIPATLMGDTPEEVKVPTDAGEGGASTSLELEEAEDRGGERN